MYPIANQAMFDHRSLAYALLRITFGVMLLTYGVNKLVQGPGTFAEGLSARFADSWLPDGLVLAFGYVLPFAEVVLGALIALGLFNTVALVGAAIVMGLLVFGAVAEPNPPTVANNVLYALVAFVLLWLGHANHLSLDAYRRGRVPATEVPAEEDISLTPRR